MEIRSAVSLRTDRFARTRCNVLRSIRSADEATAQSRSATSRGRGCLTARVTAKTEIPTFSDLQPAATAAPPPSRDHVAASRPEQQAQHTEHQEQQQHRHAAEDTQTTASTTVPPCPHWCTSATVILSNWT